MSLKRYGFFDPQTGALHSMLVGFSDSIHAPANALASCPPGYIPIEGITHPHAQRVEAEYAYAPIDWEPVPIRYRVVACNPQPKPVNIAASSLQDAQRRYQNLERQALRALLAHQLNPNPEAVKAVEAQLAALDDILAPPA